MNGLHNLTSQLTDSWLIKESDLNVYLSALAMQGKQKTVKKSDQQLYSWYYHSSKLEFSWDFEKAPEGSVAVIDIDGITLKGGSYYSLGYVHLIAQLKKALDSDEIVGIVLRVDSPGGQLSGLQTFIDLIQSSEKPIYAFVNDGKALRLICKAAQIRLYHVPNL